jgi:GntR family transcriptional regulator
MTERKGYADIAAYYRQKITDGDLAPGDPMPSMREVCDQFGVAITTANRAFRVLKAEGLTVASPGIGTVVASEQRASAGLDRLDRMERTGKAYIGGETSSDHIAMIRSCADPDIVNELDIEPHDEIVIRRRIFETQGKPSSVALSCIHIRALATVPELQQQGKLDQWWQTTYTERTGRTITRSPERRMARLASNDELAALQVDVPPTAAVPVLVTHTTFYDEDGPIEVWEDVYAPGIWQVASS